MCAGRSYFDERSRLESGSYAKEMPLSTDQDTQIQPRWSLDLMKKVADRHCYVHHLSRFWIESDLSQETSLPVATQSIAQQVAWARSLVQQLDPQHFQHTVCRDGEPADQYLLPLSIELVLVELQLQEFSEGQRLVVVWLSRRPAAER
jgi:hypothetical protein